MILFPLAIALNFHKIGDTRRGGLTRRGLTSFLLLWQRCNIGKHFGWFSLLAY
jgi:hypothetical protein